MILLYCYITSIIILACYHTQRVCALLILYSRHVFFASTPHSEAPHDSALFFFSFFFLLSRERAPQNTKRAAPCSKSSLWTTSTARRRSNLPFSARFVRKSPSSSRSSAATINTGRKNQPRIQIRMPPLLPRSQTPMTTTNRRRWTF